MTQKSILPMNWETPDLFRERLGKRVGRQRPMAADGHLLLVLHAPPIMESTHRVGRLFWRDSEGNWKSNELGNGAAALGKHLDEYDTIIAALDRKEEEAETAEEYSDVLERLAPLLRSARNQHHVLQEARKMCPGHRELIDLRDRAYAIERSAELLYGETKNSLDLIVARQAEEQAEAGRRMAESSHRLSILAAVFLPILAITAILGVDLATLARLLGQDPEKFASLDAVPILMLGLVLIALILGAILTTVIVRPPRSRQKDGFDREHLKKLR